MQQAVLSIRGFLVLLTLLALPAPLWSAEVRSPDGNIRFSIDVDNKGAPFCLGALTDETARRLSIPLSFLDSNATYVAEIYRDGDGAHWKNDPYKLVIEEREFSQDDMLELPLAAGGGAAVRFRIAE